jgi:hypothetical protein
METAAAAKICRFWNMPLDRLPDSRNFYALGKRSCRKFASATAAPKRSPVCVKRAKYG